MITFQPLKFHNSLFKQSLLITVTANNGLFNAIDRTYLAYTEVEISKIMWRGVFYAHKVLAIFSCWVTNSAKKCCLHLSVYIIILSRVHNICTYIMSSWYYELL